MSEIRTAQLLQLASQKGVLRPSDLRELAIPRAYLSRMVDQGLLIRTGRGLYVLADADLTEHHSLAEASRRVPRAIVCLLSALNYHEMTSQLPHEVWLAIDRKDRLPVVDSPRVRIVRFSGEAMTAGVIEVLIEGVPVKLTDPARTVADCFKYRNKIGVDVAVEALRVYLRDRRGTIDALYRYARLGRVANVIQPFMDSLA
jgi:predicted transcriptional regulator of viral defense system